MWFYYDFPTRSDFGLVSVCKFGGPYVIIPLWTLSYNPAEYTVVFTISLDNGLYKLSMLPTQTNGDIMDSSIDGRQGLLTAPFLSQGIGLLYYRKPTK